MKKKLLIATLFAGACMLVGGVVLGVQARATATAYQASLDAAQGFLATGMPTGYQSAATDAQPPVPPAPKNDALYTYEAPEGFTFKSYSQAWDGPQLELLYHELKQNRHGAEIETLHEVIIHAQASDTAMATHASDVEPLAFSIQFAALPTGFQIPFPRDISVIELYNGDNHTTVESMARSLSHEYGHLFTFYYMLGGQNLMASRYAQLRGAEKNDLLVHMRSEDYYNENHHRFLIEVAAEDYVLLMGSPTTRQVVDFPDVRDLLRGASSPDDVAYQASGNAWPQENMMLPLATEVPGLADYFYGFIDEAPPVPQQEEQPFSLTITPGSVGYDLVDGYRTFVHYTLQWQPPYPNAIYTVACYDPKDYYVRPIKTLHPGDAMRATVGNVTAASDSYVSWQYDEIDRGTKVFYVVAQLPDGSYYVSDKLTYTF